MTLLKRACTLPLLSFMKTLLLMSTLFIMESDASEFSEDEN